MPGSSQPGSYLVEWEATNILIGFLAPSRLVARDRFVIPNSEADEGE